MDKLPLHFPDMAFTIRLLMTHYCLSQFYLRRSSVKYLQSDFTYLACTNFGHQQFQFHDNGGIDLNCAYAQSVDTSCIVIQPNFNLKVLSVFSLPPVNFQLPQNWLQPCRFIYFKPLWRASSASKQTLHYSATLQLLLRTSNLAFAHRSTTPKHHPTLRSLLTFFMFLAAKWINCLPLNSANLNHLN